MPLRSFHQGSLSLGWRRLSSSRSPVVFTLVCLLAVVGACDGSGDDDDAGVSDAFDDDDAGLRSDGGDAFDGGSHADFDGGDIEDGDAGVDAGPLTSFIVGGTRPVEVFVPDGHSQTTPMPLVLFLHGYGASGALMESYLGIRAHGDERGFLYAHPEGRPDQGGSQYWNASGACCDFYQSGVDDSAYLRGLIDEIADVMPVDPARVFLIGHSNGAFMAYRMACDHSDVIAGVVTVAGAMMNAVDGCDPTSTTAVLHVHGTLDETILYAGGNFGGPAYPGAVESVEQWSLLMTCDDVVTPLDAPLDLDVVLAGAETTGAVYGDDCAPGGHAELWTVAGGGHILNASSSFVPAVLDFLYAHPK